MGRHLHEITPDPGPPRFWVVAAEWGVACAATTVLFWFPPVWPGSEYTSLPPVRSQDVSAQVTRPLGRVVVSDPPSGTLAAQEHMRAEVRKILPDGAGG